MTGVEGVKYSVSLVNMSFKYNEIIKNKYSRIHEKFFYQKTTTTVEFYLETIHLEVKEEKIKYDDIVETVEWLIEKLSDISRKKGKKGIIIQFRDDATAKKVAGFGNGKIFKKLLELANLISSISELSDDDEKTYYILKPVVNSFSKRVKNISIKKSKLKIKVEIELKNVRFIAEYKRRVNFSV